jgi:hypothetical protein
MRPVETAIICVLLAGCASTTVEFTSGAPTASLCQSPGESVSAVVLWEPRWRPDQKEPQQREAYAERGIRDFFDTSHCYSSVVIRRLDVATPPGAEDLPFFTDSRSSQRILVIAVRELGPIIRLLGSPALIEGGTEVVLDIAEYRFGTAQAKQAFSVHWRNGGPGVIKTTATLDEDIKAALANALKPIAGAK